MVSRWALKLDSPPAVDAAARTRSTRAARSRSRRRPTIPTATRSRTRGISTATARSRRAARRRRSRPTTARPRATVTVQATDPSGLSSTDTATVTVRNVAPTATFQASGSVTAGDTADALADGSERSVGGRHRCGLHVRVRLRRRQRLRRVLDARAPPACPAPARGTLSVGGEIKDKDGGIREYRSSVTVNGRSPVVDAGGPYAVDEGGSVTVAATGSDPDGDAITYAWDLDNNGTFETAGSRRFSTPATGRRRRRCRCRRPTRRVRPRRARRPSRCGTWPRRRHSTRRRARPWAFRSRSRSSSPHDPSAADTAPASPTRSTAATARATGRSARVEHDLQHARAGHTHRARRDQGPRRRCSPRTRRPCTSA